MKNAFNNDAIKKQLRIAKLIKTTAVDFAKWLKVNPSKAEQIGMYAKLYEEFIQEKYPPVDHYKRSKGNKIENLEYVPAYTSSWVINNDRSPDKDGEYLTVDSAGTREFCNWYLGCWHSRTGHPVAKWLEFKDI